jgi:CubicO group peptidase (beta-lactamase class C family)
MADLPDRALLPLPAQPADVAWPTDKWDRADPVEVGGDAERLDALLDALVQPDLDPELGRTSAAAVVVGGRLVAERYGHRPVRDLRSLEPDPPLDAVDQTTELLSWSMAKSITSLAVGVAVADGALVVTDPVGEPAWAGADDPRRAITWDDLLAMRPGLAWQEEYYDLGGDHLPDVVQMLFGDGAADMAGFAASFPLVHQPGSPEAFTYSSGTTNIVAANLQRVLGLDAAGMDRFLHERIFDPIGMRSARAEFDAAGTFIGSSYVYATLQDWCRFGLLALRGGAWDGRAIVAPDWIDEARRPRSWSEDILHGAHWWTWDQDQMPFGAHGFEGQRVICFPTRDLVVVRLGWISSTGARALNRHLTDIADCFPTLT